MELKELLEYLDKQGFERKTVGQTYSERINREHGLVFYIGYSHGVYFGCGRIKEGIDERIIKFDTPIDRILSYDIDYLSGQKGIDEQNKGFDEIFSLIRKEIRDDRISKI